MLNKKKTIAFIICAVMAGSLVGCKEGSDGTKTETTVTTAQNTMVNQGKVKLKSYKFPEFFNEIKIPDELSRKIFSSFDESKYAVKVSEQPFSEYNCEKCFNGEYYTFKKDKYMGLLDANGKAVIEADTYTNIQLGSPGMLILSYDKEMNTEDDFAVLNGNGKIKKLDKYTFDENSFEITEKNVNEEKNKNKKQYILSVNGTPVSDASGKTEWDSISLVDIDDINTTHVYKRYYKVSRDGAYYYICFDKLYNYAVYEGAYAYIKLKVGGKAGECYVLSYDDYSELNKMISSFGDSKYVSKPSKDNALDYVQLSMGLNEKNKQVITISSDGYCFTDNTAVSDSAVDNKYFSYLDKESFVSIVLWIEQVLSKEYVN